MIVLGAFLHMYLTQAALGDYQIRLGRVFTMLSRWEEDELGYLQEHCFWMTWRLQ